jgi:tripartite-type tricarboxylate transporter receptor subunit TctC
MLSRRVFLSATLAAPALAYGQGFASRNITIIAPFAPSASADGLARLVGEKLSEAFGRPSIIENRPGGGGTTGLIAVARSAPDGHTLGIGAPGALVINPHVSELSANFNPLRELAPIAKLVDIPLVLVAHPGAGFRTLNEMIVQSKAKQGGLTFGSTGVNSAQHLSIELLKKATGANLSHVPYRGSAPVMTDLLGGQIPMASVDLTSADPHIKSGSVIPLAITAPKRVDLAPEIPTIAETAVPNFELTAWLGLFGPAGLPRDIVEQVSGRLHDARSDSAFLARIRTLACVEAYLGPQDFAAFLERESAKMRAVVQGV